MRRKNNLPTMVQFSHLEMHKSYSLVLRYFAYFYLIHSTRLAKNKSKKTILKFYEIQDDCFDTSPMLFLGIQTSIFKTKCSLSNGGFIWKCESYLFDANFNWILLLNCEFYFPWQIICIALNFLFQCQAILWQEYRHSVNSLLWQR